MIRSQRLTLLPFDESYANELYRIWNDEEVIKYTYMKLIDSMEKCINRINMLKNHTDERYLNNCVVMHNDKIIGCAGYPIRPGIVTECGMYYHFSKEYWGHGYATETVMALKKYIFSNIPSAVIKAEAAFDNIASVKILEKCGFKTVRVEKDGFNNNGIISDMVHFISENN